MFRKYIRNFSELASTKNREYALALAEAGLAAIDTREAIRRSLSLSGNILRVQGEEFDISAFRAIKVVGFGKASAAAAEELENILGSAITSGAVIGLSKVATSRIESFAGTHPKPSVANVEAGQRVLNVLQDSTPEDLVIALVSGGGSALLCGSEEERRQGVRLYESFLSAGRSIGDLNTIRKHISELKGGGLLRAAYPATIIGLIFSDVPGNHFPDVASGPTYPDETTVADAQRIIEANNLGNFDLVETPKDQKYFEKARNFVLVSNETALAAMSRKAEELGFSSRILSSELYEGMPEAADKILDAGREGAVVLAGGEPGIKVGRSGGRGGRNLHMALTALSTGRLGNGSVFISLASDGLDNSDAAGAVVDRLTLEKAEKAGLYPEAYLERFDSYSFFERTGDMLITGPTGANVSDLFIYLTGR